MSDTSPGTASGHGRAADGGGAPLLQARELSRTFGKGATAVQALRGIDLSVRERTMVAIIGSSGSGKSTLLHLLGALDRPATPAPSRSAAAATTTSPTMS